MSQTRGHLKSNAMAPHHDLNKSAPTQAVKDIKQHAEELKSKTMGNMPKLSAGSVKRSADSAGVSPRSPRSGIKSATGFEQGIADLIKTQAQDAAGQKFEIFKALNFVEWDAKHHGHHMLMKVVVDEQGHQIHCRVTQPLHGAPILEGIETNKRSSDRLLAA